MMNVIFVEDVSHPFAVKRVQIRIIIQRDLFHVETGSQVSRSTDNQIHSALGFDQGNFGVYSGYCQKEIISRQMGDDIFNPVAAFMREKIVRDNEPHSSRQTLFDVDQAIDVFPAHGQGADDDFVSHQIVFVQVGLDEVAGDKIAGHQHVDMFT